MRAISLWQPHASAIPAGLKTIETRSWATDYRGPLAIHAAKRWTKAERAFWQWMVREPERFVARAAFAALGIEDADDLPRGAIVATCEVYDCKPSVLLTQKYGPATKVEQQWGNFESGRFGWLLRNIVPLKVPVPCVGRQGFFSWDPQPVAATV
jgi:hypothetical protein